MPSIFSGGIKLAIGFKRELRCAPFYAENWRENEINTVTQLRYCFIEVLKVNGDLIS